MGSLSAYVRDGWINYIFKGTAFAQPSSLEVALYNGDPGGAGTECPGTNYTRAAVVFSDPGTYVVNTDDVSFPTASDDTWGDVDYWAIFDDTGSNMLAYGQLKEGVTTTIVEGNPPVIPQVEIEISVPTGFSEDAAMHLLRYVFCGTAYTSPSASIYIALATSNLSVGDTEITFDEAVGNNYARVHIPASDWVAATGGNGQTSNGNATAVAFPTPSGDWEFTSIVVMSNFDDSGEIIAFDNRLTDGNTSSGDTVEILQNQLVITLS